MCVLLIMLHVCTTSLFERDKARVLDKADLSRKGSVDALIRSLVDCINACEDFYTTSSCSGRAVVFCEVCVCVCVCACVCARACDYSI